MFLSICIHCHNETRFSTIAKIVIISQAYDTNTYRERSTQKEKTQAQDMQKDLPIS